MRIWLKSGALRNDPPILLSTKGRVGGLELSHFRRKSAGVHIWVSVSRSRLSVGQMAACEPFLAGL